MFQQYKNKYRFKVLLAATGSVAAIKLSEIVKKLSISCEIRILLTESTKKFIKKEDYKIWQQLGVTFYTDKQEESSWKDRGDPVLHIQLRKWADAMIIAPLSANTLAKISNGICDNLVTLACRCWDFKTIIIQKGEGKPQLLSKPLIVCPAMNTMMWEHPITAQQLKTLKSWGVKVVEPIEKTLMCGDTGKGAMNSVQAIIYEFEGIMNEIHKLQG